MTTGMSAPPIGSTSSVPSAAALTSRTIMRVWSCDPATIATPQATAISASSTLTGVCSAPMVTGLPSISSWSLANATFEPQNDTEPTIAANTLKIAT